MNDLDERIASKPAPKVTPDRIAAVVASESFHRLTTTLTVCVLTLANGFTVTGESACAAPENYDETIGNELARKDAERKIWALEGYLLREKLAIADSAAFDPGIEMSRYIGTKVIYAKPMTRQEYNDYRGWDLPADENGDDAGWLVEYADSQRPNVKGHQGYVSWSPADVFNRSYSAI